MRRTLSALLLCLLLAAPAPAQDRPPKLFLPPARVSADAQITLTATVIVDRLVVVRAKTEGATVRWYTPDKGLEALPPELLPVGGKVALFAAKAPGTYRVVAFTAINGEPTEAAEVTVTVEGPPFPPIPPVPPVPPVPPPPIPPIPPPVSPLGSELQARFNLDQTPGKAEHLAALAEVYKQAATTLTQSQALKTNGDLLKALKASVVAVVPAAALTGVRERIAVYLDSNLGTKTDAVFDRGYASDAFTRVAKALAEVKP